VKSGIKELFVKTDVDLLSLGLPSRLLHLYGRLRLYAGRSGKCCPKHSTLAKEIGLRSREHLQRLVAKLQRLRLIESKRGRYFNTYRVLNPDVTFLSHQMQQKSHISDVTKKSHRKDVFRKEVLEKRERRSSSQSSSAPVETGGLAGLLTQVWNHVPGSPGPKLLARIAAALGDAPLEQFHELLVSRRRKAQSFGLAAQLAAELSERWKAEAAQREPIGQATAGADVQHKIEVFESALADPSTAPEMRAEIEQWLTELRTANGAA
jgi:hypothetical protein